MSEDVQIKLPFTKKRYDVRTILLYILVSIGLLFTFFSWVGLVLMYTGWVGFITIDELAGGLVVESVGALYTFGLGFVLARLIQQEDEARRAGPSNEDLLAELRQLRQDVERFGSVAKVDKTPDGDQLK